MALTKRSFVSRWLISALAAVLVLSLAGRLATAQVPAIEGNKAERLEWFRDLGFGLFIHWSLDSQIGSVISHSLVGASPNYVERFFTQLPLTFNPSKFDPDEWAVLSKLAGFKYVVFTAKHHSGFCMYNTGTTDFSIMNTPYGKDLTAQLVRAYRDQGIAIGFYHSPDDFHFLHKRGKTIARRQPGVTPQEIPALMKYDQEQIRELMTQYGKVDMMFLDGPPEGLSQTCWAIDPDVVVTRGGMETPEQYTPGVPLQGAWEGNLTMGTQWQYKPTNDDYKSGGQLIKTLIETRAKGGNLLLNIGPKPNGELPIEQEERLREMALWMFINSEAIYEVRPWVVTNEGDVWFTKRKDENTVYAIVTGGDWPWGEKKSISLKSVGASAQTKVSILGQSDQVLEYRPEVDPKTTWRGEGRGIAISAYRAQRIYNDRRWPNPVVLKITNAEVGMEPPAVMTHGADLGPGAKTATLRAELKALGKVDSVEVGFQYRRRKTSAEMYEADFPWVDTKMVSKTSPGAYSAQAKGLEPGRPYEYRAVVKHPLITLFGISQPLGDAE